MGFIVPSPPRGDNVLVYMEVDIAGIGAAIWRVCGTSAKADKMWNKDHFLGCFPALKKIVGSAWFVFY